MSATVQESTALKKAKHDIKDATESYEKNKRELAQHEANLVNEEKKLMEIQDSLSGISPLHLP